MSIVSFIVVFVCTWWVVLFTVLPWGIQLDESGPEVSGPGAPVKPNLKKKFWITTAIAAVISLTILGLVNMDLISFRDIATTMSTEDYQ